MNKKVSLIGAPTDIGASTQGASMGPQALRVAGLGLDMRDGKKMRWLANHGLPNADRRCRILPPQQGQIGLIWSQL